MLAAAPEASGIVARYVANVGPGADPIHVDELSYEALPIRPSLGRRP